MTPSRHPVQPKVFRIGVNADRVLRKFAEQGAEIIDECAIHVVRNSISSGRLFFTSFVSLSDGLLVQSHAGRITGIDDEERFDLRVSSS